MKEWSSVLYSKIRKPIVNFCIKRGIRANHVTLFNSFFSVVLGFYFFSTGQWIAGLCVCLVNGLLDYLDGDLAKSTGDYSKIGVWLDSGFDVIFGSIIMGAIAIGSGFQGLSIEWIIFFFIGNSANNFVSFNYNQQFGFNSDKGNELFRNLMDRKCHPINRILKNMIDPTSSHIALMLYTYRYWIAIGCLFSIMPVCFKIMTVISNIKWIVMYLIYAFYLIGEKRLFVLRALSMLDEENSEFYRLRNSTRI